MNEIILAPCPHCGAGVSLLKIPYGYAIACDDKNCLSMMQTKYGSCDNKELFLQKLISDWNKRVPEIKAVTEAIQSIREYRDHVYDETQEPYDEHGSCCIRVLDEAINILQCFTAFDYAKEGFDETS